MSDTPSPMFVSQDLVPERAAPVKTTGFIGFLRTRLFNSPTNILITIVSALLLWFILVPALKFALVDAVWTGADRTACLPKSPGDVVGACWPFIQAKLPQFIYGFYPEPERWRVVLSFLIGVAGIYGLLGGPERFRKQAAILFFVLFPILSFWLLRGGLGLTFVPTAQWGGFMLTLVIALVGIVLSLPFGILLALGRRSSLPIVHLLCVIFIEFVRGVPLITVIFMANIMLPLFLPQDVDVNVLLRVLVGTTAFVSAYMAEVVRGGLQAIPKGQFEGAMALGLGYWNMMRLIILPQALRIAIPSIVNTFIGFFKDTTLVSMVGLYDFLNMVKAGFKDANWVGVEITGFMFCAAVYWVCCFSMSRYSMYLERKLHTGHKKR